MHNHRMMKRYVVLGTTCRKMDGASYCIRMLVGPPRSLRMNGEYM
jgi:hypothetical protein